MFVAWDWPFGKVCVGVGMLLWDIIYNFRNREDGVKLLWRCDMYNPVE
jgi:hypothetical protein